MNDEFTPINEIEKIVQNDKSSNNGASNESDKSDESMTNIMGININLKQLVWLMIVFFLVVNPYTVNFLMTKVPFLRKSSGDSSFDGVMSASDMKYVNDSGASSNLPLLLVQGGLYGALILVLTALLQLHYI